MENQQAETIINESKSPIKRFFTPKIIFGILAIVIVVEIIFAIRVLTKSTPLPSSKVVSSQGGAQIRLTSSKREFKVGELVPVAIVVHTGGQKTLGTDAILQYDPKVLEASVSSIVKGNIYREYPGLQVDQKKGLVSISGISSDEQNSFMGFDVLGTVKFKARASGATKVNVVFTPGSTTDSNIVDLTSNEDILEKVINLNVTIK